MEFITPNEADKTVKALWRFLRDLQLYQNAVLALKWKYGLSDKDVDKIMEDYVCATMEEREV